MIFGFSLASNGCGREGYHIYQPFMTQPDSPLGELNKGDHVEYTTENYHLKLKRLDDLYVLIISEFYSHEEAKLFMLKTRASLLWFSLRLQRAIKISKESDIYRFNPPIVENEGNKCFFKHFGCSSIDGMYQSDSATIIPIHKTILQYEGGKASVSAGVGPEKLFSTVNEALSFPYAENVISNKKLLLALELYASHQFEVSKRARLINLVTSLEAVTTNYEVNEATLEVFEVRSRKAREGRNPASGEVIKIEASKGPVFKTGKALKDKVK